MILKVKPETQVEGHTCGLHAMRAFYRYLHLPVKGLRDRLGTDNSLPVLPGRSIIESALESRGKDFPGTWPQDIIGVLREDGLNARSTANFGHFCEAVAEGLKCNLPALALVDGMGHWVVVCGKGNNRFWIADSCSKKVYSLTKNQLRERFNCGIFIRDTEADGVGLLGRIAGTGTAVKAWLIMKWQETFA